MTVRTALRPLVHGARAALHRLHNAWLRPRFAALDPTCRISPRAILYGTRSISIGAGAQVFPHAVLNCTYWHDIGARAGSISIGPGTVIQPFAFLHSHAGSIRLGKNCSVNPYAVLYGEGGLQIGDNVRIAAHTAIIPGNHQFDRLDIPISEQGLSCQGIVIEDDVWIGAGVRILDGVRVARGCVIGAGSVVTRSTEPYGVYVGSPARLLKTRGKDDPTLPRVEKPPKM